MRPTIQRGEQESTECDERCLACALFSGPESACKAVESHDAPGGDHRFYNNLFTGSVNLLSFNNAKLPCFAAGNVFTKGTQPSKFDTGALVKADFDAGVKLEQKPDGWYLPFVFKGKAYRLERDRPGRNKGKDDLRIRDHFSGGGIAAPSWAVWKAMNIFFHEACHCIGIGHDSGGLSGPIAGKLRGWDRKKWWNYDTIDLNALSVPGH
jgi:hypothetical protein